MPTEQFFFEVGERCYIERGGWAAERLLVTVRRITPTGQVVVSTDYNPTHERRFKWRGWNYPEMGGGPYYRTTLQKLTPEIERSIRRERQQEHIEFYLHDKVLDRLSLEELDDIYQTITPYIKRGQDA